MNTNKLTGKRGRDGLNIKVDMNGIYQMIIFIVSEYKVLS
jgi:hypothetical protein